jgi:integrase
MANKGSTLPAEIFGDETLRKIFQTFPPSPTGTRNRALIMVYLRCQLRCNEALDLRVCDVSHERGSITVLKGKGGKRRVVGCDAVTLDAIREWIRIRPVSSDFVFCTHKGGRMTDSYVRKMFKRHAKKAGVTQRVHIHGLRHTGACKLADARLDLRIIQRQLGHSSLAVTDRYLNHLGANDVVDAVSSLEW